MGLLFRQGHELRMGHEAVDGATGLWALQPLVQGATERVHHLNLEEREEGRQEDGGTGGTGDSHTNINRKVDGTSQQHVGGV